MRTIALLVFTLSFSLSFAQSNDVISVAELTLDINKKEELHYAFAAGDQIVFDFEEVKGKELKQVEIMEYPNSLKFSDYKTNKIIDKRIQVHQNGVFVFRFHNSSVKNKLCKVKIGRIPGSPDTKLFDTNVKWETQYDTIRTPYWKNVLVGNDTSYYMETKKVQIVDSTYAEAIADAEIHHIHDAEWSLLEGKIPKRGFITINLPSNVKEKYRTIETQHWALVLAVDEESTQRLATNNAAIVSLAGELGIDAAAAKYGKIGKLVGGLLKTGTLDKITSILVGSDHSVDFWVLQDYNNAVHFKNGGDNFYYLQGLRGTVKMYSRRVYKPLPQNGNVYLGLQNNYQTHGLNVFLTVVVIRRIKMYKDIQERKMKVTPRYEKQQFIKTEVKTKQVPIIPR